MKVRFYGNQRASEEIGRKLWRSVLSMPKNSQKRTCLRQFWARTGSTSRVEECVRKKVSANRNQEKQFTQQILSTSYLESSTRRVYLQPQLSPTQEQLVRLEPQQFERVLQDGSLRKIESSVRVRPRLALHHPKQQDGSRKGT
jgi:hypothetical protein